MKRIFYLLALVFAVSSCKGEKETQAGAQYSVKVTKPESVDLMSSTHKYPFIVKPYNESELSFRISGPLNKFTLQPGDYFRKGQLIMSVDNRDFVVRKQQSEAIHTQAKQEYKRIESLYNVGNISGSLYEKAKADYLVAETNLQTATNALKDTEMRAPFDGYIQSVKVEPYEEVKASQPILTFIEVDRLKAEVFIPEHIAQGYRRNISNDKPAISLKFDSAIDSIIYPKEVTISKSTSNNNLSFVLTASIDNKSEQLLGGMSGELTMELFDKTADSTLYLPLAALCNNRELGDYVWVIEDSKPHRRPVKVGKQSGNKFEIKSGITKDDEVALTRKSFLVENTVINIIR